jgi:hypothetical protein
LPSSSSSSSSSDDKKREPNASPPSPSPAEVAAASKAKWLLLSPTVVKQKKKGTAPKFKALGPRATASIALGSSRPKRSDALLAAANDGDALRLRALIDAGVDVDASDEYGATALFLASWRGREDVVKLLLASGADATRTVKGGRVAALDAARNEGVAAALTSAMKTASATVTDRARRLEDAQLAILARVETLEARAGVRRPTEIRVRTLIDPIAMPTHPGAWYSFCVDGGVSDATLRRLEATYADASSSEKPLVSEMSDADDVDIVSEFTEPPPASASDSSPGTHSRTSLDPNLSARLRADTCATRWYFLDATGWARDAILAAAIAAGAPALGVHPQMRLLRYPKIGGVMAPHVDLPKAVDPEDSRGVSGFGFFSNAAKAEAAADVTRTTHTFLLYLRTCERGGETALLREIKSECGAVGAREAAALADVRPVRGRLLIFPHECPHAGRPVTDRNKLVVRGELWLGRESGGGDDVDDEADER